MPTIHDIVAWRVYSEIHRKDNAGDKEIKIHNMVEHIATHNKNESWRIVVEEILIKCNYNNPDKTIWDREDIEHSCGNYQTNGC